MRLQKLIYGFGSLGPGSLFAFSGFYLLFFYTDVVQLPAAVVAIGVFVGRAWDIVNDPLVGWLSDRSTSRFGKRRSYVVAGALPLTIATILLVSIPEGQVGLAAFAWLVGTFVLWDAALTIVHVPFYALAVESHPAYDERTSIVSYGAVGALIGYAIGGVAVPQIAEQPDLLVEGYGLVGVVLGVLAGLTVGIAGLLLRERDAKAAAKDIALTTAASSLLRAKVYRRLMFALGASRVGLTVASASLVFYVVNWLKEDQGVASLLVGVLLLAVIVSIPVWRWVSERWDKAPAYRAGLATTAVGLTAVWFVPSSALSAAAVAVAVVGLGSGAHWIIPWSMLPDATEQVAGVQVGTSFGVYGVIEKLTRSAALVGVSTVLALAGYEGSGSIEGSALTAIRLLASLVPAGFLALAAFLMRGYPISRRSMDTHASAGL